MINTPEDFFLKQMDRFPQYISYEGRNYGLFGYKLLSGGYRLGYNYLDWDFDTPSNIRQNILETFVSVKGDKPMIVEGGGIFADMVCEPTEQLAVERIISDFQRKINGLSEYTVITWEDTQRGKEQLTEIDI